jgi:hypothetical protein
VDDRGAEDRLPEGGYAHINVRPELGALVRQPHAPENLAVEVFEIKVWWNSVHKSESEGLGGGKEAETCPWSVVALYIGLDPVDLKRRL